VLGGLRRDEVLDVRIAALRLVSYGADTAIELGSVSTPGSLS
jgi:hypothetical protein